jgi:hypothetical protein
MADYVIMFPADNEAEWESGTEADHQAIYDTDFEFAQLLKARGGAVTGGAGLADSSKARTIKRGPKCNVLVTEGPFAESVEQISGFFIVNNDTVNFFIQRVKVLQFSLFDIKHIKAFVLPGADGELNVSFIPKLELCYLAALIAIVKRYKVILSELRRRRKIESFADQCSRYDRTGFAILQRRVSSDCT